MPARVITPPLLSASLAPARPPEAAPGHGTRVWLVRHAEVHPDWQARAYGSLDVPLSDAGLRDTHAMARAFAAEPVTSVTSSHLARALAMGRGIADATGAPLLVDERLREIWRGEWQGILAEDFRARWEAEREVFSADPWNWKGHRGESDADVFARAWPALLAAVETARGGTAVLTAHYNVIRVLVTRALGLAPHESYAFRNDPAHATLLSDLPEGWKLVRANVATPVAT